jgi:YHS domain-containing protein
MKFVASIIAVLVSVCALAAPVQFTPQQQESINKLNAKGGLVMQLANDTDALVINLSLGGKQITDAEVAEVKNFPKVAQLNLANTAVTDAGVANVAGLAELTNLHLEKTGVTDAALSHLKGLAKLEYLNLYSTGVTDAGLAQLHGLKNLKRVYLWQSKVSDAGADALKKAVPGVVINRGEELKIVVVTEPPKTASAAKPINTVCPVSGKPVDAQFTVAFEGKTVGFCCNNCPKTFEKEPAKFKDKIKADAAPATPVAAADKKATDAPAGSKPNNTLCPRKNTPVNPELVLAYDGKIVGLCCQECFGKFKENPSKYVANLKFDVATPEKKPEAKPAEKKPEDKKPAAAAKPVNAECPVSGQAIKEGFLTSLDGKSVGFCCDKCLAKFNQDPKAFAEKIK